MGTLMVSRWSVAFAAAVLAMRVQMASAGVFSYQDDFETNKAEIETYRSSPFADMTIDWPILTYMAPGSLTPPNESRVLLFYPEMHGAPYLEYKAVPAQMVVPGGSVEFDLLPGWPSNRSRIAVYGRAGYKNWVELGYGEGLGHHVITLLPGSPAEFIKLQGGGIMDNLRMSISYVPEPGCLGIMLLGALGLLRRRETARC